MTDDTDTDDDLIRKSAAAERVRRIRAGVLHLVDLKRAGHSPRYCELIVDSRDRIVAQPQRRASPMRETSRPAIGVAQSRSTHPGGRYAN